MAQTKQQKAVVRRWIKALESGEYKQGRKVLVTAAAKGDSFCCLGVLCDLAVRAKVIEAPPAVKIGETFYYGECRDEVSLPSEVREWAGLTSYYGYYDDDSSLAELNDMGKTFKTIAKVIKSAPKGLFE